MCIRDSFSFAFIGNIGQNNYGSFGFRIVNIPVSYTHLDVYKRQVLTYLLNDTDVNDKYTAAVITNDSNCNMILRLVAIKGDQIYNLPVQRNSKNQFKILKGSYTLKSNICGANYYSQKTIIDPLILKLGNN